MQITVNGILIQRTMFAENGIRNGSFDLSLFTIVYLTIPCIECLPFRYYSLILKKNYPFNNKQLETYNLRLFERNPSTMLLQLFSSFAII